MSGVPPRRAGAAALAFVCLLVAGCSGAASSGGSPGSTSGRDPGSVATGGGSLTTAEPTGQSGTAAGPTTTTQPTLVAREAASYGVGLRTITFVDTSRDTLNYDTTPPSVLSHERVLVTTIRYPTTKQGGGTLVNAPPVRGSFPVIVFAHGYAVTPHTYEPLLDAWAKAGFVVVAPVFPVDNYFGWEAQDEVGATEQDIWNEPEDVAFVLHHLVPAAQRRGAFLHGVGDWSRVALAGQSDGGDVVAALAYGSTFAAARAELPVVPKAVAILSGAELIGAISYGAPPGAPVLLSVQSNADDCNPPWTATQLHNAVAPGSERRFFLALEGAGHLQPYQGQRPWSSVTQRTTVEVFRLALKPRSGVTTSEIERTGNWHGVSWISTAPSVSLPPAAVLYGCPPSTPNP